MNTRYSLLLPQSPLPLLLLLLLTPDGGTFSLTMALNCPADFAISGIQQSATVESIELLENGTIGFVRTYVHPEQGFKGVSLVPVEGMGISYTGWFPLHDCFPSGSVWWWGMMAEVEVLPYYNHSDYYYGLMFQLRAGVCRVMCTHTFQFRGAMSLKVVAHGPSKWKKNDLEKQSCTTKKELTENFQNDFTCNNSSPKTITPCTGLTSMEVVMIVVVVLVLVLLTVVQVAVLKRKRQEDVMLRSQGTSASTELVVVENNLYEPFENFHPPQPRNECRRVGEEGRV